MTHLYKTGPRPHNIIVLGQSQQHICQMCIEEYSENCNKISLVYSFTYNIRKCFTSTPVQYWSGYKKMSSRCYEAYMRIKPSTVFSEKSFNLKKLWSRKIIGKKHENDVRPNCPGHVYAVYLLINKHPISIPRTTVSIRREIMNFLPKMQKIHNSLFI